MAVLLVPMQTNAQTKSIHVIWMQLVQTRLAASRVSAMLATQETVALCAAM
jgi:hypothetical protein